MIILSSAYLGNLDYYRHLVGDREVVVDLWEHYRKQSHRNRCDILSSSGVQTLTIPVLQPHGIRQATRSVAIDYSKAWQHNHWLAIVSAYRNSPYFDEYESDLRPFYHQQTEFLWEFNDALQRQIFSILGIDADWSYSSEYQNCAPELDLRDSLSDKHARHNFSHTPYYQVFGDKLPFESNLSILDLLFCEGPHCLSHVQPITY